MSSETDAFLESVRGAEDPTPEDERRVLAGVRAAVAAGALLGTAAASSKWTRLWTWSAGAGAKGGAAVVVVMAAAAVGVAAFAGAFSSEATPVQVRGGAVAKLIPVARTDPRCAPDHADTTGPGSSTT